jgi:hypothetical protein
MGNPAGVRRDFVALEHLGRSAEPPESAGLGLPAGATGTTVAGVSAGLRAGVEPGGIPVVALEAARTAQPVPEGLRDAERARLTSPAADASPPDPGGGVLGTGGALSIVTILCGTP